MNPPAPLPPAPTPALWALLGCGLFLLLLLGALGIAAFSLVLLQRTAHSVTYTAPSTAPTVQNPSVASAFTPPPSPPAFKPLPDGDVLAARMKWDQDVYQKLRDGALAAYASQHPTPAPIDDDAHAMIKLLAYLATWGDYYGEGLWQQYDTHFQRLPDEDPKLAFFNLMDDMHGFESVHSSTEEDASTGVRDTLAFQATTYPAYFKFLIEQSQLKNLFESRDDTAIHAGPGTAFDHVPALVDLTTQNYAELLSEHFPNPLLFRAGTDLMETVSGDETTLKAVSAGLGHAFDTTDKSDPLADVLKGEFYVKDAWCARGNNYASNVTSDGWKLFGDRLATANQILTAVYAAHPEQTGTPRAMMTVVLGQQQSRDQMELWYQRGLKLNPDPYSLNMAKRWYLLPRWYGSDADVWAFGLECAKSDDWATKTPAMLIECISDAADNDPAVYARPEIWTPLEQVFRDYLTHFPNAVTYRTNFLKCAAQGSHWDVAAEQLKLLGNDWDRSILKDNEYAQIRSQVAANKATNP